MEELLYRYFQGNLEEGERLALLQEVEADPVKKKLFIEIKNLYALSMLTENTSDIAENMKSYNRFKLKYRTKSFTFYTKRIVGYAATILLIIGSTYWFTLSQVNRDRPAEMLSLHVPAGQRLQMTLQDGTKVWLNAKTTMTYPTHFKDKERRVSIDGEALFEVAKDEKKPFIVSSHGVDMKVLGTCFNLYGYSDAEYIRTSLLEGSLKIYREKEEAKGILLYPNQEVTISNDGMNVDTIVDLSYFQWTEGVYSFHNEPLFYILQKLELYYDVKFLVKDPTIYTWEYTGKFRQRDGIDGILHIIQKIHKFKVEKDEENNTIILS